MLNKIFSLKSRKNKEEGRNEIKEKRNKINLGIKGYNMTNQIFDHSYV